MDEILLGAARRLSIDIANLTMQLAILQSKVEALTQFTTGVDPSLWTAKELEDVDGTKSYAVLIPLIEADQLRQILTVIGQVG